MGDNISNNLIELASKENRLNGKKLARLTPGFFMA